MPVAWFDPAGGLLRRLDAGVELVVIGRVRRRFFRAAASTASATEVVADQVVLATQRKRAERLLGTVGARLAADSSPPVSP